MGRQKLQKYSHNKTNPFVIEAGKPEWLNMKGQWADRFGNNNPIVVELACGRGEYTIGLANEYPEKNFIGIDIKGNRIWKGASQALESGITNACFLRCYIQNLEDFFAPDEISELWITFPDPRPRGNDERRRLTFPRFMIMYQKLLQSNGLVHLKTDSDSFFDYTLEVLQNHDIEPLANTRNLYDSPFAADHKGIKTRYEGIFSEKGFSIKYLRFRMPKEVTFQIPEKREAEPQDS